MNLIDSAGDIASILRLSYATDTRARSLSPTTVELARALTAMRLCDHRQAVTIHRRATGGDGWHLLPAEHRTAHLIDIARAHLDLGDAGAAGRALVAADAIAPAEIRIRPAVRTPLTAVLRAGSPPPTSPAWPPPSD